MGLLALPARLPDLVTVPCRECGGEGGHEGQDTDAGATCATCGGSGVYEVCSGCGEVPGSLHGLEVCGCVVRLGQEVAA